VDLARGITASGCIIIPNAGEGTGTGGIVGAVVGVEGDAVVRVGMKGIPRHTGRRIAALTVLDHFRRPRR